MANRNVKLKNKSGDYLYPYTDNIPTASTSAAGKVKLDSSPTSGSNNAITSGAVYTALSNKANDSAVAHKTGTETIGGAKTFSETVAMQFSSFDYKGYRIQNKATTKGTAPTTNTGGQFVFQDSTGAGASGRLGGIETRYATSGAIQTYLQAFKPEANSSERAEISITYPVSGSPYTNAPTPTDTTTTTGKQIATTGWVNTRLNSVSDSNNNNSNLSNCLTEVPQHIILELNDNTLVLKAGSKVYTVSDTITIDNDISYSAPTEFPSVEFLISVAVNKSTLIQSTIDNTDSVSENPNTAYMQWFNTSNKKCYINDGLGSIENEVSLPIAVVNCTQGLGFTSIKHIFNGFGFIGKTIFALPNVQGLAPNGRNIDGSLKSTQIGVSSVLTYTYLDWTRENQPLMFANNDLNPVYGTADGRYFVGNDRKVYDAINYVSFYDLEKNIIWHNTETAGSGYYQYNVVHFGSLTLTNGKISNFEIDDVIPTILPSMLTECKVIVETYLNGTNWYRIWSDGWIEQGGSHSGGTSSTINLLKPFANTNYTLTYANWGGTCYCYKANSSQIYWHDIENANGSGISWYACGY